MLMQNKLLKYKIGLLVMGLFVIGAMIFLIMQASATKSDTETYKNADKTASALNDYIDQKQAIPDSLNAAKITYDTETVAYTKISAEKYKFCVTYKTDSGSIDGTSLISAVMYAGFSGGVSGDYDSSDDYESSSLYISNYYKKGENCQTVSPYLYDDYDSYYDDTADEYSPEGSGDEAFSTLTTDVQKCTDDTTLSDDAYNTCVDKAYEAYYQRR